MCKHKVIGVFMRTSMSHRKGVSQRLDVCLDMCRHEVIGVFMRNWDESEERGESACSAEADWTAAQIVASHLRIPIHEADFVRQYWTQVFSDFVAQVTTCHTHIPSSTGAYG